jgi:hypothetical protein
LPPPLLLPKVDVVPKVEALPKPPGEGDVAAFAPKSDDPAPFPPPKPPPNDEVTGAVPMAPRGAVWPKPDEAPKLLGVGEALDPKPELVPNPDGLAPNSELLAGAGLLAAAAPPATMLYFFSRLAISSASFPRYFSRILGTSLSLDALCCW